MENSQLQLPDSTNVITNLEISALNVAERILDEIFLNFENENFADISSYENELSHFSYTDPKVQEYDFFEIVEILESVTKDQLYWCSYYKLPKTETSKLL